MDEQAQAALAEPEVAAPALEAAVAAPDEATAGEKGQDPAELERRREASYKGRYEQERKERLATEARQKELEDRLNNLESERAKSSEEADLQRRVTRFSRDVAEHEAELDREGITGAPREKALARLRETLIKEHDAEIAIERASKAQKQAAASETAKLQRDWAKHLIQQQVESTKSEEGLDIKIDLDDVLGGFNPKGDAWFPDLVTIINKKAASARKAANATGRKTNQDARAASGVDRIAGGSPASMGWQAAELAYSRREISSNDFLKAMQNAPRERRAMLGF